MLALPIPSRTLGALLVEEFCPRCFWVVLHCENKLPFQIPMPGIFSSIDVYGKNAVHAFFDQNRRLPSWFPGVGEVKGYVPSKALHWSRFKIEDAETRVILRGTPDDIFQLADGTYHIVDYKTAKATKTQDHLFPVYEVQLNVYAYICSKLPDLPVSALSRIYMEPVTDLSDREFDGVHEHSGFKLSFSAKLRPVQRNPEIFIVDLMRRARSIYDQKEAPAGRDGCQNCNLLAHLQSVVG